MNKLSSLSVFFPTYNEEKNIQKAIESALKILPVITDQWEILVVNDGSKDQTGEIVKQLMKKEPRLKMITHTPNRGYGAAVKTGLYNFCSDWLFFTDADGQFDFLEIKKFVACQNQADLIIGYRLKRSDPALRIFLAKLLKIWDRLFFGLKVCDPDCAFKLIKRKVIEKIPHLTTESALTVTEFLVRSQRAGFKIKEIGVHHYSRTVGQQTGGNPKVIFKALKETFWLWWQLFKEGICHSGPDPESIQ